MNTPPRFTGYDKRVLRCPRVVALLFRKSLFDLIFEVIRYCLDGF